MSEQVGSTPSRWGSARRDVIAGISVALVLVPQSLAYAELAGMPPIHGVYAAAAAPIAAAFIGSSPYLQTGPVALTSLLTFGALAPHAAAGSSTFVSYAALLALLVGIARLALGLLRWGPVAYLMSLPVMTGFTVAAAMLIIASQLPGLVSVSVEAASPAVGAARALAQPNLWSTAAIVIGLGTIAVVMLGRRISPLFPWALLATVAPLTASALGMLDVRTVGPVPSGLPGLQLDVPWHAVADLALPALLIAIVGFAEPASIARRYATADRTPWDPDKEFIGQGLGNLAAGLFGAFPVGGSFSRSALNRLAGARTRLSGAVTGLTVVAVLPFAGALSALPRAVLSGLVIVAAVSLVEFAPFREHWRHSRPQFLVSVPTFAVTLLAAPRVEYGLLVGVGLSLGVHLWREMRLDVEVWRSGEALHVRPHGVLYFASAPMLEMRLASLLGEHPDATRIVLDLRHLGRLDLTGLYALRGLAEQTRAGGVTVEFDAVPGHVAERLQRVMSPDP